MNQPTRLVIDIVPVVVDKLGRGRQGPGRWPLAVGWSAMFRRLERMLVSTKEELGLVLADAGSKDGENAARAIVERMGRARMGRAPGRTGS